MRLTRKRLSSNMKKIKEIDPAEWKRNRANRLQYRCSLQGIHILYEEVRHKLRKGHHDAFKKTPFKHLFKALHDGEIVMERRREKILDNLILCYDRKTQKFKLGSEFYKPTRLDVKLIFGIEDGTKDVSKAASYGRASKLGSRHFANDQVTVKKAKEKVKELVDNVDQESIDDTVKLLCVLILQTLLFPNTGAKITRAFLYYVDHFDRLSSYDWSQHVLDELMSGLQADWSDPKQVNGCVMLLPYWFCEHSYKIPDMYKNDKEEPMEAGGQVISSKGIPRLTKWKLNNLEILVEKSVLYNMDKNLFNNNELIPTIAEEHLIKSLSVKQKANYVVMEHDLALEQPPADDETLMDLMKRKYQIVKRVQKKNLSSEGSGVESGYSLEGNQESDAAQVENDIEIYEAECAYDELMVRGFDTSENVEEPRNSSKGKSIAEARNVRVQKKELGEAVTVLGKRKQRLTEENVKEKYGVKKDVEMKRLEEEISRLKGIVDSLKWERVNMIGKQETMAAEHFEMELALDEEVSTKTELLCELENEKLARKELLNELALAKIKIEQLEDKAKENESMQMVQNLPHNSVGQNFGQGLIQQQIDKTMIETLVDRVARLEKAMHEKDTAVSNIKAMNQDYEGTT